MPSRKEEFVYALHFSSSIMLLNANHCSIINVLINVFIQFKYYVVIIILL